MADGVDRIVDPIRVFEGDSIDVLRTIPDGTYTAVVSDPPYGLSAPPDPLDVLAQWLTSGDFVRTGGRKKAPPPGLSDLVKRFTSTKGGGGFLGHSWDSFVPGPALWSEVARVCRPGAIALVACATRTIDWMMLALRLGGFEILDVIGWVTAEAMPHAGTIDKRIDACLGVERSVIGKHPSPGSTRPRTAMGDNWQESPDLTVPGSALAAEWEGWSTTLCPGIEPFIVARKKFKGTAVANVLEHGCGAMNVRACSMPVDPNDPLNDAVWTERASMIRSDAGGFITSSVDGVTRSAAPQLGGRWPKNVLFDEAAAELLDRMAGERKSGSRRAGVRSGMGFNGADGDGGPAIEGSVGGASRYFWVGPCATEDDLLLPIRYVPKVRRSERESGLPVGLANTHSTVKPVELMRWLCRLVGHPRGRILDPFLGSGSTLVAARAEGLPADGVEREPEYARFARLRAGVATLADYWGLPPLHLPTDPRSALDEWMR